jgi:hypothetical protein
MYRIKTGDILVSQKKFSGHGDFFKNGTVPGKMGQIGTLVKYQTF